MGWISYRVLPKFEYHEPKTLKETLSLLATYSEKAKIMAGGTDLLVSMKNHDVKPNHVINISKIADLSYIENDNNGLRIGSVTALNDIKKSEVIGEKYLLLHEAVSTMGSMQIRNKGTIGGNLCNASPAADTAPVLLALNAILKLSSSTGERIIPLEKFFMGLVQTALKPEELLTEIQVPSLPDRTGTAFIKTGRNSMDLAKLSVAVAIRDTNDICEDVRIALGAVASTPIRAKKAEEALKGKKLEENTIENASLLAADEVQPSKPAQSLRPHRTTFEYRKKVTPVFVKRAMKRALERAKWLC